MEQPAETQGDSEASILSTDLCGSRKIQPRTTLSERLWTAVAQDNRWLRGYN